MNHLTALCRKVLKVRPHAREGRARVPVSENPENPAQFREFRDTSMRARRTGARTGLQQLEKPDRTLADARAHR
jgi:hypothetical protein